MAAKYFTIYWTPDGWAHLPLGSPLQLAAGSDFSGKISVGDRVYITNVKSGRLRLLGSFVVGEVWLKRLHGKPPDAAIDKPEYLLALPGSGSQLQLRVVPDEVARALKFHGPRATLVFEANGNVDRQTLRTPRELIIESSQALDAILQMPLSEPPQLSERLPVEVLNRATPSYVWSAVQVLLGGGVEHPFGESTDYDLIADDGQRLAPKAVFGLALTAALGWQVRPVHFSGGVDSPCFRLLNESGFAVIAKGDATPIQGEAGVDPTEVAEWMEGAPTFVAHRRRERGRGLAKAKKDDFRSNNDGKLFCERCGKDPVVEYSSEHADSCIEVHHATTMVKDMEEGHVTTLDDVQCVCANCHRIVHRLLRLGLQ